MGLQCTLIKEPEKYTKFDSENLLRLLNQIIQGCFFFCWKMTKLCLKLQN